MTGQPGPEKPDGEWGEFRSKYLAEIEGYKREIREKTLMLEQSQMEMRKLAQRNASITAQLQQIKDHLDSLSKAEIKLAYESALETQQRLFIMRGQLEKLQSDQAHLQRYVDSIEGVFNLAENMMSLAGGSKGTAMTARTVEMLVQAQEAERLRLSRQMHDGPAQSLSNFILQTDIAMRLFDMDIAEAREELVQLKHSATTSFQQVRDFIFELRPMMLDDLGLIPTLKRYVDWFKEQSHLEIRFTFSGSDRRLEPYQEVMIFRAIQELLNNVTHHSEASEVKINLDVGDNTAKAMVEDNGKGFEISQLSEQKGMGLRVIRERVESLGGTLDIDSISNHGVRVNFQIPAEISQKTPAATLGIN